MLSGTDVCDSYGWSSCAAAYSGTVREAVPSDVFVPMMGVEAEVVDALCAAGLLDPEGDGRFDDIDVLRLTDLKPYLERGYTPARLAQDIRDGKLEVWLGELLFDVGETVDVREAAERLGFDVGQLAALLAALGLPDDRLSERDLEIAEGIQVALASGLPYEGILETARVLGDSMRRIAEAETRLVHVHMHERLIAAGVPEREVNEQIFGIQDALAPMMDPMLVRFHHRHLMYAAVEDALLHTVGSTTPGSTPGSIEVTIVFVDLASFTLLTETQGDAEAVRVLGRVDELMRPQVLRHHGRVVKQIGDGFMLAFREAADAVRATIALREVLAEPGIPNMRAGINTGVAVFRGSDYLGSTVNVASRVASAAMADQILLTSTTADRISGEGLALEEVGVRLLRGVDEPLALYRPVGSRTA
jgi:adenylate cyclase